MNQIDYTDLHVVCLAGGVGGAKLAHGLAQIISPEKLSIIVNTGDDFTHCGLPICPDLDTVLYTLAGVANLETGWGREAETWRTLTAVAELGGPTWFKLGDLDLATHLTRAHGLAQGSTLTHITTQLATQFGIQLALLPMSDAPAPTYIGTTGEPLPVPFQQWFVRDQWQPPVEAIHLPEDPRTTRAVMNALERADVVIIAPSNPFVSIDPILNCYPIRNLIADLPRVVIAVSPIIGQEALKGPAAKLLRELGHEQSAAGVARYYDDLLDGFVYDQQDGDTPTAVALAELDIPLLCTETIMRDVPGRAQLATEIMAFAASLLPSE